jgi:hypothetical protein
MFIFHYEDIRLYYAHVFRETYKLSLQEMTDGYLKLSREGRTGLVSLPAPHTKRHASIERAGRFQNDMPIGYSSPWLSKPWPTSPFNSARKPAIKISHFYSKCFLNTACKNQDV